MRTLSWRNSSHGNHCRHFTGSVFPKEAGSSRALLPVRSGISCRARLPLLLRTQASLFLRHRPVRLLVPEKNRNTQEARSIVKEAPGSSRRCWKVLSLVLSAVPGAQLVLVADTVQEETWPILFKSSENRSLRLCITQVNKTAIKMSLPLTSLAWLRSAGLASSGSFLASSDVLSARSPAHSSEPSAPP